MRIIIVGAGVIGLASAYRLARSGCDVVVLDARRAGSAASHGNAAKIALAECGPVPAPGVVVQSLRWMLKPDSPLYVRPSLSPGFARFMLTMARHCTARDFRRELETHLRLAEGTTDLFDDWGRDGVALEMHKAGTLLAFETRERFDEHLGSLDIFERFDMVPERLHGGAVQAREPALTGRIRHGLFFPYDRQVEPDSLTQGLLRRCQELGVEIREHTRLLRFLRHGDAVTGVLTDKGEITGTALLLAAGAWTARMTRQLGIALPIRPGKGYSVDYCPAPVTLRTSLTLEDARVAVTPLNGFLRLAGTMEFGELEETINPGASPPSTRPQPRRWQAGITPGTGTPVGGPAADDPGRTAHHRAAPPASQRLHRLGPRHARAHPGARDRSDHHRSHHPAPHPPHRRGRLPAPLYPPVLNVTVLSVHALAGRGWKAALLADAGLAEGLYRWDGHLVGELAGMAHGIPTVPSADGGVPTEPSPPHPFLIRTG